jgi:hypothetical protein
MAATLGRTTVARWAAPKEKRSVAPTAWKLEDLTAGQMVQMMAARWAGNWVWSTVAPMAIATAGSWECHWAEAKGHRWAGEREQCWAGPRGSRWAAPWGVRKGGWTAVARVRRWAGCWAAGRDCRWAEQWADSTAVRREDHWAELREALLVVLMEEWTVDSKGVSWAGTLAGCSDTMTAVQSAARWECPMAERTAGHWAGCWGSWKAAAMVLASVGRSECRKADQLGILKAAWSAQQLVEMTAALSDF